VLESRLQAVHALAFPNVTGKPPEGATPTHRSEKSHGLPARGRATTGREAHATKMRASCREVIEKDSIADADRLVRLSFSVIARMQSGLLVSHRSSPHCSPRDVSRPVLVRIWGNRTPTRCGWPPRVTTPAPWSEPSDDQDLIAVRRPPAALSRPRQLHISCRPGWESVRINSVLTTKTIVAVTSCRRC